MHPLAPERIKKILPDVKIIILLRNPIDRAYSHYNMQKRNNYEKLSFEDAIKLEKERIKDERQKEILDGLHQSKQSFEDTHKKIIGIMKKPIPSGTSIYKGDGRTA